MEPCNDFTIDSLDSFEPLVNPVRQYRNRSKKPLKSGDEKLAEVLAKIASLQKTTDSTDGIDRTKLRTYNVKLRLKKSSLYRCFECGSSFTNADFLELHEKSHNEQGKCDIDLNQDLADESEMNLKQNAWFVGEFDDDDDDGEHIVQLDCTVEENEANFDITFDRAKCEKTYTVKYKVKKEPVGKCETCEKTFYSSDCFEMHKLEHEKALDIADIEPSINIQAPKIEESTMTLDDSFYRALDVGDLLELSEGTIDCMEGKVSPKSGITFEYKIIPRRLLQKPGQHPAHLSSRNRVVEDNLNSECQSLCHGLGDNPVAVFMTNPKPVENGSSRFQCRVCAKRFRFRPALAVHERTHDGTRPFRCAACKEAFISKGKLFLHSLSHSTGKRELHCRECKTTFTNSKPFFHHLAMVHRQMPPKSQ